MEGAERVQRERPWLWPWEPQGGWQVRRHLVGVERVSEEGREVAPGAWGRAKLSFFFSSSEEAGEKLGESGGREVGDGATRGGGVGEAREKTETGA